jgi:hypothetical protein
MTAPEAAALALAGMPGPAAELGLGGVLAAAQLKLDAALPAEMRVRMALIRARFHLDTPGWYHDGDAVPHLHAVADAVWQQQRIQIRYRRWRAPTDVDRRLDPQILSLAVMTEHFERTEDFGLAGYWGAGITEFRVGLHQEEATIRLSPTGLERAAVLCSSETIRALRMTASRCRDYRARRTAGPNLGYCPPSGGHLSS